MPATVATIDDPHVRGVLQRLGLNSLGASTVVVSARLLTDLDADLLWDTWADLERWPTWSRPLHCSARWLGKKAWEVGARFEQCRCMGFPFGRMMSIETVREVNAGTSASWWKQSNGLCSCQMWSFEPQPHGGTIVGSTEVWHGPAIALAKPFVRGRWNVLFDLAVHGLVIVARHR